MILKTVNRLRTAMALIFLFTVSKDTDDSISNDRGSRSRGSSRGSSLTFTAIGFNELSNELLCPYPNSSTKRVCKESGAYLCARLFKILWE